MDRETKLEALLRTLKMDSYAQAVAQFDAARILFIRHYTKTHERVNGRRRRIPKPIRIRRFNDELDRLFGDDLDIRQDAINQIRALDDA